MTPFSKTDLPPGRSLVSRALRSRYAVDEGCDDDDDDYDYDYNYDYDDGLDSDGGRGGIRITADLVVDPDERRRRRRRRSSSRLLRTGTLPSVPSPSSPPESESSSLSSPAPDLLPSDDDIVRVASRSHPGSPSVDAAIRSDLMLRSRIVVDYIRSDGTVPRDQDQDRDRAKARTTTPPPPRDGERGRDRERGCQLACSARS